MNSTKYYFFLYAEVRKNLNKFVERYRAKRDENVTPNNSLPRILQLSAENRFTF